MWLGGRPAATGEILDEMALGQVCAASIILVITSVDEAPMQVSSAMLRAVPLRLCSSVEEAVYLFESYFATLAAGFLFADAEGLG